MALEIPAGKECGNRTRHHQGGRKDLSDHRRERRGQIEAANKDHSGGRRDPLGRNVATEKDTTKAEEISHKDQVRGLNVSNLAPLRIGYRLNIGGRKEATTGPVQP